MTKSKVYALGILISLFAIVTPIWATTFILGQASPGMFNFSSLAFRSIGNLLVAIVPILLVLYYRKRHHQQKALVEDILPISALFSMFSLVLGLVFFNDSYSLIMSEGAVGPSFAIGIIKIGGVYIPTAIFIWALGGAWIYILQDFIRRNRDEYFPTRAIISSCFRVAFSLATALLLFLLFQVSEKPVYSFEPASSDFAYAEKQHRIYNVNSKPENVKTGSALEYYSVLDYPSGPGWVYLLAGLCFFSGMYPRRVQKQVWIVFSTHFSLSLPRGANLNLIQGITLDDEERLSEEGYESVQRIATADYKVISEQTQFPAETVKDWIAQAKLIGYFPDAKTL